MNIKLLIDSIMRQTTVLIAQLSTSAGVRAPLAHIADQVFLSLSREIEAQGVGKRVIADMFGLALRSYQKKTLRLGSSATVQGKTLFEAVLDYVEQHGYVTRSALLERFRNDGDRETCSVLNDLVMSGLLYTTGAGHNTLYGMTTDAQRQRLTRETDRIGTSNMALGEIYRNPGMDLDVLTERLAITRERVEQAVEMLVSENRVTRLVNPRGEVHYHAASFEIPTDTTIGWESAVFDHFQALSTAIARKLQYLAEPDNPKAPFVGGTTLRFELHQAHPHLDEVLALLGKVRALTNETWDKVSAHNDASPNPTRSSVHVCFYFGQDVEERQEPAMPPEPPATPRPSTNRN
jgi:hypothetical protein